MSDRGRRKSKSEYVAAVSELLDDVHPELIKALNKMNSQHLIMLAKSISERHNVQMPRFPTKTIAQQTLLYKTLKGNENESNAVS